LLRKAASPGGTLIHSGVPIQDKFDVQLAFQRQGCMLRDSCIGEEYMTFIMEAPVAG
jgi:hypothetical protein